MTSLLEGFINWLSPPLPHNRNPVPCDVVKPDYLERSLEWSEKLFELQVRLHRMEERAKQADALRSKRNGMIGRLNDCRWRVSVLMVSKTLPADYAMRMRP